MGQYYKPVAIDRNEYLHPHRLGDGLKLMELGRSAAGTMAALVQLLHMPTASQGPAGRWAGQRVVLAGDYADEGRFLPPGYAECLYSHVTKTGQDVSEDAVRAVLARAPTHLLGATEARPLAVAYTGQAEFAKFYDPTSRARFDSLEDLCAVLGIAVNPEDHALARDLGDGLARYCRAKKVNAFLQADRLLRYWNRDYTRVTTLTFTLTRDAVATPVRWRFPLAVTALQQTLGLAARRARRRTPRVTVP